MILIDLCEHTLNLHIGRSGKLDPAYSYRRGRTALIYIPIIHHILNDDFHLDMTDNAAYWQAK